MKFKVCLIEFENRRDMKSVNYWLEEYSVSHQNALNIMIHKLCVPLIVWCILGFLWLFSSLILICTLVSIVFFYGLLSIPLCLGFLLEIVVMLLSIYLLEIFLYEKMFSIFFISFVLAWILQFIGHLIEGKKPSFLKDLQFLLIGPLWSLSLTYKKLKIKF